MSMIKMVKLRNKRLRSNFKRKDLMMKIYNLKSLIRIALKIAQWKKHQLKENLLFFSQDGSLIRLVKDQLKILIKTQSKKIQLKVTSKKLLIKAQRRLTVISKPSELKRTS